MKFHHRVLAILFFTKNLINKIFKTKKSEDSLRVLMYHNIPNQFLNDFDNQLEIYKKNDWTFISPEEFRQFKENQKEIKGKNLLLTFDDGFFSNRIVAEKILNKYKIKSIFFIPTDFLKCSNNTQAHEFVEKNLKVKNFKLDNSNKINMTIEDLKFLINEGHSIGHHTKSHKKLNSIQDTKTLSKEIIQSADFLEQQLNSKINFFAYTWGDIKSFNFNSFECASKRFDYTFSSIRGNNINIKTKNIFLRDAMQPHFDKYLTLSLINGLADFYYIKDRLQLKKWSKKLDLETLV